MRNGVGAGVAIYSTIVVAFSAILVMELFDGSYVSLVLVPLIAFSVWRGVRAFRDGNWI